MTYASLSGLEGRMGAGVYARWMNDTPNAQEELAGCEERVLACILPARPRNAAQAGALERAVYAQLNWEFTSETGGVPEGVKSFSVNGFSAQLESGRFPLCREAKSILLNAGLLCREVGLC